MNIAEINRTESKILVKAFFLAALVEFSILTAFGIQEHWLAHPQKEGLDESKFIQAEVFQPPPEGHLTEVKRTAAPRVHERVISKTTTTTKAQRISTPAAVEEKNQTVAGPQALANHGPVALVAPAPSIPSYLRDKDINSSVVIEFLVNSQGTAVPRLIGSSGNDELDVIALNAAKQWRFRPAEQNHQAIDSKIRLRINFDVH